MSALLGVKAGDVVRFTVDDDGSVAVKPVKPSERLGPWVGYFKRRGVDLTRDQSDAFVRELRGPLEDEAQT